jgi:hypothetical protein
MRKMDAKQSTQKHSPVQVIDFRQPSPNREMLSALRARGIDAGSVRRNRRTGVYAVRFSAPEVTNFYGDGTDSAQLWARRIQNSFDGVEIVDTYDTVADWRPQRPVLFATVFLRGELKPKAS